ncbi:MAG TPA: HNH endonuclease signature motif containing protein [Gemmataceae bacterium]|jgi:hypothetical protein|nr:HNH endonuclease signature motif containing protein [Gemmataceae bacterium]
MEPGLVDLVWQRAQSRCEYCQLPQTYSRLPFEIDHIIACKHGGQTRPSNLALSCFYCNSFKGSNISGLDPRGRALTGLFHPRRHKWRRHFRWDGPILVGRTPVGRTTVAVLLINLDLRVAHRQELIDGGVFLPPG